MPWLPNTHTHTHTHRHMYVYQNMVDDISLGLVRRDGVVLPGPVGTQVGQVFYYGAHCWSSSLCVQVNTVLLLPFCLFFVFIFVFVFISFLLKSTVMALWSLCCAVLYCDVVLFQASGPPTICIILILGTSLLGERGH